jgi:ATP-dependent DNA ligase
LEVRNDQLGDVSLLNQVHIREISDSDQWNNLMSEIKFILQFSKYENEIYYQIQNLFNLPLHMTYLIIEYIRKGKELKFEQLASVSYYAVCRDILTQYKNKVFLFNKFFNYKYPYLKNTDERLEWFLKHDNGLNIVQKISLLEEETNFNSMGIGRKRFELALSRFNLGLTHEEVERRRLQEYDGIWSGAVSSFIKKERGDLTAAEILLTADALAEDTRITIKIQVLSSLLERMGKIEIYFIANQVNKFHDRVSRTSSLVRAVAKVFGVEHKTIERLVSMHSMVDVARLVMEDKILEQYEKIIPFRPFKPMLAQKWNKQYKFPLHVEAKYDGVRLLIHKLGDKISCFSRRRKNYMYKYYQIGELVNKIPAYSIIMDGEISAFQTTPMGTRYLNVYELHEALKGEDPTIKLFYVVFDILYYNGQEIINYPFEQRIKLRNQLMRSMKAPVITKNLLFKEVEHMIAYDKAQLITYYNQFVDGGLEGAIVKFPKGIYELGKRSEAWLKLKPKETLDVVITGVIPLQDKSGIRIKAIRYAVPKEDELVNLGMITNLDSIEGIRIYELILDRGLLPDNPKLVNLGDEIESHSRFGKEHESIGIEIDPNIVISIDSLGTVKRGDKVKLRNARFLYIREDKELSEVSTYYDVYNYYMESI